MTVMIKNTPLPTTWLNLFPSLEGRFGKDSIIGLRHDTKDSPPSAAILSDECRAIEMHEGIYQTDTEIPIPEPVRERLAEYRATPLMRAVRWEQALGYPGEIWIKREDLTPSGSHKFNTAIPQAYYARKQGLAGIVSETGAGQWGLALAMACAEQGLDNVVFMPGHSYDERKRYRRCLMEVAGARLYRTPSNVTEAGRRMHTEPGENGRLSHAMSEALEFAATHDDFCLGQGCMSFYAPLHQSIIGLETEAQLAAADVKADILVACAGGGTHLLGFMAPWIKNALSDDSRLPRMLAVESSEVPVLAKGRYEYCPADAAGLGAKLKMYTLGADMTMPDLHAEGLRYHAKNPMLSLLVHEGIVEATAVDQNDARDAGIELFRAEGILAAPESAHALAAVKKIVSETITARERPKIVVCLSGSGHLDVTFYSECNAYESPRHENRVETRSL